jgi:hypothetical protein
MNRVQKKFVLVIDGRSYHGGGEGAGGKLLASVIEGFINRSELNTMTG